MANQTKADKAGALVKDVADRVVEGRKALRTAEELLMDLEDRAARREAREARRRVRR